jgi:hypothetical protein
MQGKRQGELLGMKSLMTKYSIRESSRERSGYAASQIFRTTNDSSAQGRQATEQTDRC